MISRIYVLLKKGATRADSYLVDSQLSKKELERLGSALTNPILETFYINELPCDKKFTYAFEIGFLPGVTDNVGHTVKEIVTDLFKLKKNSDFQVYTSKIYFVQSRKLEDVHKLSLTFHNPLIERAFIMKIESGKVSFPMKVPKVVLKKRKPVLDISLDVLDEELIKIGRE